jgi:hypothetical protein
MLGEDSIILVEVFSSEVIELAEIYLRQSGSDSIGASLYLMLTCKAWQSLSVLGIRV